MSDQAGFLIGGKLYPFAEALEFGDATLVYAATKLEFEEWAQRVDKLGPGNNDVRAVLGLAAVSVSRAEPDWSEEQVLRFVKTVDLSTLDIQQPDDEEGDVGVPPVEPPAAAEASSISPGESTSSPVTPVTGAPV